MPNACDYNCTDLPEHEQITCGEWKKAGIGALAYIDCDNTITDWSDPAEWLSNIAAGKIKIASPVRASIPEPSAVEGENPNGCGAATIVDTYDHTVEIKDFNYNQNNIDFYNKLNKRKTYLALVGCDGLMWVVDAAITWNARATVSENNREKVMFMITGAWTEFDMPTYFDVPAGIFE
jgi:hypothetical protein